MVDPGIGCDETFAHRWWRDRDGRLWVEVWRDWCGRLGTLLIDHYRLGRLFRLSFLSLLTFVPLIFRLTRSGLDTFLVKGKKAVMVRDLADLPVR